MLISCCESSFRANCRSAKRISRGATWSADCPFQMHALPSPCWRNGCSFRLTAVWWPWRIQWQLQWMLCTDQPAAVPFLSSNCCHTNCCYCFPQIIIFHNRYLLPAFWERSSITREVHTHNLHADEVLLFLLCSNYDILYRQPVHILLWLLQTCKRLLWR